jgi:hypothetical protein
VADGAWVLRVEGVNFDATLTDTQDLSTVRGSGLALLEVDRAAAAALSGLGLHDLQPLFAGASQAAFVFRASEPDALGALARVRQVLAAAAPGQPPHHHLMYVVDIASCGDPADTATLAAALDAAEARNRARQYRSFTVPLPDPGLAATRPDPLDHARQATVPYTMPGGVRVLLSPSVMARREYGRAERAGFYRRADGRPLAVCDSFEEIVASPPAGLPAAVPGKLAFLYGDGNGFGAIRRRLGVRAFARQLAPLQQRLLRRLTGWFRDGLAAGDGRLAAPQDGGRARIETLLWGGDDFLFVMPAWLGLHVAGALASEVGTWALEVEERDGRTGTLPLTVGFGLAICHHHTPVRQARAVAWNLAESAKRAFGDGPPATVASIQVFESLSPLDAPLPRLRAAMFGGGTDLDQALAIDGASLPGLAGKIAALTAKGVAEGGLSPGVLHEALAAAQAVPGGVAGGGAAAAARNVLAAAYERFGRPLPDTTVAGVVGPGQTARGLAIELALIAMLRDYCGLSGADALPPLPEAMP